MTGLLLISYIFLAYGATNIIVNGRGPYNIVGGIKGLLGHISSEFTKMFECMMCTGFNVGLILSVVSVCLGIPFTPFTMLIPAGNVILTVILDSFFTSGAVWVLDKIELIIETHIKYDE